MYASTLSEIGGGLSLVHFPFSINVSNPSSIESNKCALFGDDNASLLSSRNRL